MNGNQKRCPECHHLKPKGEGWMILKKPGWDYHEIVCPDCAAKNMGNGLLVSYHFDGNAPQKPQDEILAMVGGQNVSNQGKGKDKLPDLRQPD